LIIFEKRPPMDYRKYIVRNPEVMMGKPTIKGSRITVELILRKLAGGYSVDDLLKSYPHLEREQIAAVFAYTADIVANEEVREAS
jgi:uncharacterized protein (DUF433 family)